MADRTARTAQTRDKEQRRKPWAPPSLLDAPEAPQGFRHRWVRHAMRGEEDRVHVTQMLRQGWEPVRADEYPDGEYATVEEGQYQGVIAHGGLMLCRIPEETVQERSAYYGNRTREQMQAVDQDLMKDEHPSMPITRDRRSRVSFGGRSSDSE
ncbi:MAG: hypothetical protein RI553_11215 [Salibaculum sp.]|uniref:hypothetical protein n=1 Tax=Salibaculum sp. TaxID=2855480 RepID=UPI00287083CC|nr:hypothetical protein [Salibaculum sp.]MDR9428662.1 hypothetical protein [Salibaculum sp.]